jgi:hypothetical protein
MTKDQWIGYVQRIFSGTIPDPEFKKRFTGKYIEKCLSRNRDNLIGKKIRIAMDSTGDYSFLDWYSKRFLNIPILTDSASNEKYINLPTLPIELPFNHPIRNIFCMPTINNCVVVDETMPFINQTIGDASIYNNLPVSKVKRHLEYIVRYNTVWLYNVPSNVTQVGMNMIVSFESLAGDEQVTDPFIIYNEHGNPEGDWINMVIAEFENKLKLEGSKESVGNPNMK